MSDKVITSTGDCSACCGGTPSECVCALLLPIGFPPTPYPDYATALSFVTNAVFGCVAYNDLGSGVDAYFDGTTLHAEGLTNAGEGPADLAIGFFSCVTMQGGENLSAAYSVTGDGSSPSGTFYLYDCSTGSVIDTATGGSPLVVTAPTDGTYVIYYEVAVLSATTFGLTFDITSTGAFVANPAIALWDDSGTTRQLEACPKMLLPTLTESSGSWQANCADAASLITNQVVDCLAYSEVTPITSGSASGTAPFVISLTQNSSVFIPWASFNGVVGDVWTFAYTRSSGPIFVVQALIYDYTGTLVETLSGATPLVSSALPYTGRYIVKMFMVGSGSSGITATVSVSSSGTLGVNPVQVLWDNGVDCPARLNCGDSC